MKHARKYFAFLPGLIVLLSLLGGSSVFAVGPPHVSLDTVTFRPQSTPLSDPEIGNP